MKTDNRTRQEDRAEPPVDDCEEDNFYSPRQVVARVYNRLIVYTLIYVLSIGPMFWRWHYSIHFNEAPEFWARIYNPLYKVCEYSPWFRDLLNWYIGLWN